MAGSRPAGRTPGDRRGLVVATRSAHKLRELRDLLRLESTDLLSLDDLAVPGQPVEDGLTFETNAKIKARHAARATGLPALADEGLARLFEAQAQVLTTVRR